MRRCVYLAASLLRRWCADRQRKVTRHGSFRVYGAIRARSRGAGINRSVYPTGPRNSTFG